MFGSIGTGCEFAIHSCLGQHVGVGDQRIDGVDTGVEVVLEDVEVTVVGVGDLVRDIALGNAVDVTGGHVQWPDHGVQGVIDAFDDGLEIALMLGRISARRQLAIDGSFGQHSGIGNQQINGINTGVEVVLEDVEIAVIGIGDLVRDVALGDAVHVVCGDVQRIYYGIERVVDANHDFLEIALVLAGIGACGQFAGNRRLAEHAGIGNQALH